MRTASSQRRSGAAQVLVLKVAEVGVVHPTRYGQATSFGEGVAIFGVVAEGCVDPNPVTITVLSVELHDRQAAQGAIYGAVCASAAAHVEVAVGAIHVAHHRVGGAGGFRGPGLVSGEALQCYAAVAFVFRLGGERERDC